MESQLDWLYKQYHSLVGEYAVIKDRIQKIAATIESFGGSVPIIEEDNVLSVLTGLSDNLYPKDGTWKEKIIFSLRRFGRPMTSGEVSQYLLENEQTFNNRKLDMKNVSNIISVTMSKMGVDGEIVVDNTSFKNKYSLLV
jgi:hypothetical protein